MFKRNVERRLWVRAELLESTFLCCRYIDKSPWPITWKESVEQALKRMDKVQKIQRSEAWRATRLPRVPDAPKLKILIVSVCEYNAEQTPLYTLSYWNKKKYADRHGYELTVHEKSPWLQVSYRWIWNRGRK